MKKFQDASKYVDKAEGFINKIPTMEDEFMDFEEDLLETIKTINTGESDKDFAKRVAARQVYVDTCEKQKKGFAKEIKNVNDSLAAYQNYNGKVAESFNALSNDFASQVFQYKDKAYAFDSNHDSLGASEAAI